MLIRYRNGLLLEAVLLSLRGGTMRVALKDSEDILELRLVKDAWVDDTGEIVTFDFSMAILAAVGIVPPTDGAVESAPVGVASSAPFEVSNFSQTVN